MPGSRPRWTGASIGAATTRPKRSRHSALDSAMKSTRTPSQPSSSRSLTRPRSRPGSRCGFDPLHPGSSGTPHSKARRLPGPTEAVSAPQGAANQAAQVSKHLRYGPLATFQRSVSAPAITLEPMPLALLSTDLIRGQQCAEAPLGRRRRDPAAAWQYSRQSRAGRYLTVEPSWLPSAACAAHSNTGRRPTVPWSPCPCPHVQRPAVRVRVRPSSVRRPVHVQCPRACCPRVRYPVPCPRPVSSASVRHPYPLCPHR